MRGIRADLLAESDVSGPDASDSDDGPGAGHARDADRVDGDNA